MSARKKFLFYTVIVLLVGLVNFLFRKKIAYAYADLLSYNSLYAAKEQFNITYLGRLGRDSIRMRFGGGNGLSQNDIRVFRGDRQLAETRASDLTMRPYTGVNRYRVRVDNGDSFDMQLEMFHGDSTPWVTLFQPVLEKAPSSVADWAWQEAQASTADEEFADRILRDSMQVRHEQSPREKVLRIARYLLSRTVEKRGDPTDSMTHLSPVSQWRCVLSGRSRLYCGNYCRILAWFANRVKVPCRIIECGGTMNGLAAGDHMFDEVYLSDAGGWAYVDLMDANVFVRKNGRLLNVIDVQRLLRYGPDPGFTALHYQGDSLAELPFQQASSIARDFFNPNTDFTFYYGNYLGITTPHSLWDKGRSFLYPKPYYALYSDHADHPGYPFYIRLVTQFAFAAGLLVWLLWAALQVFQVRFRRQR
jgi:hypothetical protein